MLTRASYRSVGWRLRSSTAITGVLALLIGGHAYALPSGGQVAGGQAAISQAATSMTISQSSNRAVINWQSFDIGAGEVVQVIEPSASAIQLERVTGSQNPTQILGSLSANGQVWIVNPNGIFFGSGAQVNVAGLVASSSDIGTRNFMRGNYDFDHPGNPDAAVVNTGTITIGQAGLAAFVAPNVVNAGVITATLGKITLASGDMFTLDLYGDGLINLQASPAITQQLVANSGLIAANGGTVQLTAAAATNVVNSLINNTGIIEAQSIGNVNGQIILYAEGSNAVQNNIAANKSQKHGTSEVLDSGVLDASGYGSGQTGGGITITGDNVGILSGAIIDASGDAGGGYIKIGGDFHGQGTTPTALNTYVDANALIMANAITSGNGGNVAVWSDNYTNFAGSIEARGGAQSGNGGFVETSGHVTLNMQGTVDASASHGTAGTWLMDPEDVNITNSDSDDTGSDGASSFGPGGNQATASVNAQYIIDALNAGTNVTVTTTDSGAAGAENGPNGGSITVSSAISATGDGTALTTTGSLTLSSYQDIIVNAAITLGGGTNTSNATVAGGSLILDSANSGNNAGSIKISANITTNGGNITMGGGNAGITAGNATTAATGFAVGDVFDAYGIDIESATISSGSGQIIMNGHGYNNPGSSNNYGLYNTGTIETTSGEIDLYGEGGNGTSLNNGITNNSGTITTVSGTLNVTGNDSGATVTSSGNRGVQNTGTISSTGVSTGGSPTCSDTCGAVTITGIGGNGTTGNYGVYNAAGYVFETVDAALNVTGTGGNGTTSNYGVYNTAGNFIESTGIGNVTVKGYGGNGTTANYGIYNFNGLISATNGSLYVAGYGNGASASSGTADYGIENSSSGTISSTGSAGNLVNGATMIIIGKGSTTATGGTLYGVYNLGTISTADAPMTVTGTGGTSGTYATEYGVYLNGSSSNITSSGLGTITLTGIGGNDSSYGFITGNPTNAINGGTANVSLITDSISLGATSAVTTTGAVTIDQNTPGYGINVGSSATGVANWPSLTDTELGYISAGSLKFGNSNTAAIDISTGYTFAESVTFTSNGSITFGSAINGNYNLTATANSFTFAGAIGGGTPFNAVSLTSVDGLTLPSISASSIFAQTTGASNITIPLNSVLTASGSGTAITLVSKDNFINDEGAHALSAPSGRWLVYSTNPANNTLGSLASNFIVFSCTYGGYCDSIPPTGNGLLYSFQITPVLSTIEGVVRQAVGMDTNLSLPNTPVLIYLDATMFKAFELNANDPDRWWDGIIQ